MHFDFVGFDACLMCTVETAKMLSPYADYMIASEETEPSSGWFYTEWLNALAENPAMASEDLGRLIVDDFVPEEEERSDYETYTLSLIDLSQNTPPPPFAAVFPAILHPLTVPLHTTTPAER